MNTLLCQLKSERIKLSGTPFFLLHLFIPVLGIIIFIAHLGTSTISVDSLTGGYYQMLGLVYIIIVALLTTMVSEQEVEAGGGFLLLSYPKRKKALFAKLIFLLMFGLLSCIFLSLGYGLLVPFVRHGSVAPLFELLKAGFLLWFASVFLYLLHMWIGLKFGKSANFGFAAFEFLMSALLLTGLGDTIWIFVPCAWSARITSIFLNASIEGDLSAFATPQLILSVICVVTVFMLGLLIVWFSRWEGRKSEE